jgi:lipoprotein-anchoring transpeptidase ErfK/SrfK
MKYRIIAVFCLGLLVFTRPANASTLAPPNLTITKPGAKTITVPIFDKWTDGATIAVGDLGTDGIPEVVLGAGPGSIPEIRVLQQNGTLIRKFNAFDATMAKGVIVSLGDANGDGKNEIIAATGPKFGKYVRVFDGYGKLLSDWFPKPADAKSVLTAATVSETETKYSVPAPSFTNNKPDIPKEIDISLAKQRLYAYENGYLVNTYLVSTGTAKMPTRPGNYSVLRKEAIKEYKGTNYDYKNTHWNTEFSVRGEYMHEAYWHNKFGQPMSHGCVNMRLSDAKFIYDWSAIGTPVIISS